MRACVPAAWGHAWGEISAHAATVPHTLPTHAQMAGGGGGAAPASSSSSSSSSRASNLGSPDPEPASASSGGRTGTKRASPGRKGRSPAAAKVVEPPPQAPAAALAAAAAAAAAPKQGSSGSSSSSGGSTAGAGMERGGGVDSVGYATEVASLDAEVSWVRTSSTPSWQHSCWKHRHAMPHPAISAHHLSDTTPSLSPYRPPRRVLPLKPAQQPRGLQPPHPW